MEKCGESLWVQIKSILEGMSPARCQVGRWAPLSTVCARWDHASKKAPLARFWRSSDG